MKCAYCQLNEADIPIVDKETLRAFLICSECDYLMSVCSIGYDERVVDMENSEMLNPVKH